jgi:uncharacterized membrane protein YfcA
MGTTLIADPLFWGLALIGLVIVGVSKGGFGGGLGVVGVPFIAAAIPVNQAAAIMLPCLIIMDLTGLYGWRGQWCWVQLRRLLPAAGLGVCIGALSFHVLSENALRVMIGVIGLGFGIQWWVQHLRLVRSSEKPVPGPWHTRFWSTIAGFTSFSVHAGGPPLQVALLPQKLDQKIYAATTVVFFTFVNIIKVFPYYWLDQFTSEVLWTALILAPIAPFAVRLGIVMNKRVSALWFYRVCYFGLVVSSARLLIIGMTT